jgi:hypothetical protein
MILWMSLGACKKALTRREILQTGFFVKFTGFRDAGKLKIPSGNVLTR